MVWGISQCSAYSIKSVLTKIINSYIAIVIKLNEVVKTKNPCSILNAKDLSGDIFYVQSI